MIDIEEMIKALTPEELYEYYHYKLEEDKAPIEVLQIIQPLIDKAKEKGTNE